jgi:hypothetical protein
MAFVALFLALKFALYSGFFYGISLALQIGTPIDALRAGFHRTWLGAAATLVSLVLYMILHLAGSSPEGTQVAGAAALWFLRVAIWIWVATWVYRVTRWRKGKLAIVVLIGLALNFAVDFGLARLQGEWHVFMPSFADWEFRLC